MVHDAEDDVIYNGRARANIVSVGKFVCVSEEFVEGIVNTALHVLKGAVS